MWLVLQVGSFFPSLLHNFPWLTLLPPFLYLFILLSQQVSFHNGIPLVAYVISEATWRSSAECEILFLPYGILLAYGYWAQTAIRRYNTVSLRNILSSYHRINNRNNHFLAAFLLSLGGCLEASEPPGGRFGSCHFGFISGRTVCYQMSMPYTYFLSSYSSSSLAFSYQFGLVKGTILSWSKAPALRWLLERRLAFVLPTIKPPYL